MLLEVAGQLCLNHSASASAQLVITLKSNIGGSGMNDDLLSINVGIEGSGQVADSLMKNFRPGLRFEGTSLLFVSLGVSLGVGRCSGGIIWAQ